MEEIKRLIEAQVKAFEDFKRANDAEIAQIKTKGAPDPLLAEMVRKANEEITRIGKDLDEVRSAAKRRAAAAAGEGAPEERSAHRVAFAKSLRHGDRDLSPEEIKLLQVGVAGDGGYAVPEELDRSIGSLVRDATPMLGVVNAIDGTETYEKLIDLAGAASGWVGETDARGETASPTLASVKPYFGEVYAFPFATQKMLDDAMFDPEPWLAESVATKFAEDIDDAIIQGNGTNKPKGILAYTLAETADATRTFGEIEKYTTTTTSASFTGDELITLIHKLKQGYRVNARFVMPTLAVAIARKLKDSVSGQYLWQPGLGGDQPARLLGYPITEDERVPTPAGSSKSVLFGDFKRAYRVVRVRGIRTLRDPFTAKPKVGFYTTQRIGGGVEDSCAVKVMVLKA